MSASTACQLLNVNTNTSRSQLKYPPRRGGASQGQHVVIYWLFLENNSDSQALLHWSLLSLPFLLALDTFEVSNWKASVGWDLKKHQVFGQQEGMERCARQLKRSYSNFWGRLGRMQCPGTQNKENQSWWRSHTWKRDDTCAKLPQAQTQLLTPRPGQGVWAGWPWRAPSNPSPTAPPTPCHLGYFWASDSTPGEETAPLPVRWILFPLNKQESEDQEWSCCKWNWSVSAVR